MGTAALPLPGFRWPVGASEKNPVFEWPGPNSHDEIHYFNGMVLERRFTAWHEDVGYDLEIGRDGGRTSVVSWRIKPVGSRKCAVGITVFPHLLQGVPTAVRWVPHLLRLRPQLRRYLGSVLRGLDWFIVNGRPVRRNQFGSHRWFSPPITAPAATDRA
jgi:hypothetical protein